MRFLCNIWTRSGSIVLMYYSTRLAVEHARSDTTKLFNGMHYKLFLDLEVENVMLCNTRRSRVVFVIVDKHDRNVFFLFSNKLCF